ncbi:MAG: carboxypeptidase regulatory-like domain-containing protein [Deltaproteobacteria bacterium]|nr:carboxypeptidase regulatory-like domain-containing protein [Deltaproteobacteria bacterium]
MNKSFWLLAALLFITNASCGDGGNEGECDLAEPDCAEGLVCEAVQGGNPHCFAPLVVRGVVLDAVDEAPIRGALVQAVDASGIASGSSDETGEDGRFALTVPAIRDAEGTPLEGSYMLRAQAAGYQPFPTAIRPALPLAAPSAQEIDGEWVIETAITTVLLLPLPGDTSDLGSISGRVLAARPGGILIVAQGQGSGHIGFSDAGGDYTIFNVPAGSYGVHGYAGEVQLDPADVSLAAGEDKTGVDLAEASRPVSTVAGNVQIVNAPGGSKTSVVLAVESTFVEDAALGQVPPGLRAGEVNGEFIIEGVPDGRYVVLAAFENDGLVRDPDQTIGGTRIVHIEVPDPQTANTVTLPEGFKVTEALAVIRPGADGPEAVSTQTPVFEWADDSSEDGYEIHVFDAFGEEIWSDEIGDVSGTETVEHRYGGPTLEEGMYYQFHAISFRERTGERTAISATEDLLGVFTYQNNP